MRQDRRLTKAEKKYVNAISKETSLRKDVIKHVILQFTGMVEDDIIAGESVGIGGFVVINSIENKYRNIGKCKNANAVLSMYRPKVRWSNDFKARVGARALYYHPE